MWIQDNAIYVVLGVVIFFVLLLLTHLGKNGSLNKESDCPFWDDGELEWYDNEK